MDHLTFIAASYAVSFLALALLVLWLVLDNRAQRRALDDLEARGVRRRAAAANDAAARGASPAASPLPAPKREARP